MNTNRNNHIDKGDHFYPLDFCGDIPTNGEIGLDSIPRHEAALVGTIVTDPLFVLCLANTARKNPYSKFCFVDMSGKWGVQYYDGARVFDLTKKAAALFNLQNTKEQEDETNNVNKPKLKKNMSCVDIFEYIIMNNEWPENMPTSEKVDCVNRALQWLKDKACSNEHSAMKENFTHLYEIGLVYFARDFGVFIDIDILVRIWNSWFPNDKIVVDRLVA